jgi:DNA-binding response OmpR family regulator
MGKNDKVNFKVIFTLASNPGKPVTKDEVIKALNEKMKESKSA